MFNLVYETNVASCRIWDALGFKRIGRVKGCGNLRSYPDQMVDAIIYGRDLGSEGDDYVSEERFEKIKYYLKHGKYPNGADRAEKSRLRSAATHYKIIPETDTEPEKLMLKDKEVISDPQKQYELARQIHLQQHGGINKTTATIADKYHWVRIKETVNQVIRNCPECKDTTKNVSIPRDKKSSDSPPRTNSNDDGLLSTTPGTAADIHMADAQTQLLEAAGLTADANLSHHDLVAYSVPVDPQIVTNVSFRPQQPAPEAALTSMGLVPHDTSALNVHGQQAEDDFDFGKQMASAGYGSVGYEG